MPSVAMNIAKLESNLGRVIRGKPDGIRLLLVRAAFRAGTR